MTVCWKKIARGEEGTQQNMKSHISHQLDHWDGAELLWGKRLKGRRENLLQRISAWLVTSDNCYETGSRAKRVLGELGKTSLGEKEGAEKHRHERDSGPVKSQMRSASTKPSTFSLPSSSFLPSVPSR